MVLVEVGEVKGIFSRRHDVVDAEEGILCGVDMSILHVQFGRTYA